jgi:hypothetical protein
MWLNTNLYVSVYVIVSAIVLITCLFQAALIVYVNCNLIVCQNDEAKYVTECELLETAMPNPIVLCQITSCLTANGTLWWPESVKRRIQLLSHKLIYLVQFYTYRTLLKVNFSN